MVGLLVLTTVLFVLYGFSAAYDAFTVPMMLVSPLTLILREFLMLAGLLAGGVYIARQERKWTTVLVIWSIGLALHLIFLTGFVITQQDYLLALDRHLALTIAAVALGFWLMHRFSNITWGWAAPGLRNVAVLLALAGVTMTVLPPGIVGSVLILLCYMIFAAHTYRALSDRNTNRTIAAHWYALALLAWLAAAGLGAWRISYFAVLQRHLAEFATISTGLALVNQIAAELRGQNQRVTGLMPFWLVAFGMAAAVLAFYSRGVVQWVGQEAPPAPIMQLYAIGYTAVCLGAIIYALGFWRRRVKYE